MNYRFADLVLRSELPLRELATARPGPAECCVYSGPSMTSSSERWDHHWTSRGEVSISCARDGEDYRIGIPGLATFRIERNGAAVTCHPAAGLPSDTLEHLLIDQVLPRVLAHRSRLVIHAGCVVTPAGAVGFLGDSGAGKSTLCAALVRAGHALLADDTVIIRKAGTAGYEALATYPGLRLLPSPLAQLFDERASGDRMAHYSAKRRVRRRHPELTVADGPQPIAALYVLTDGPAIDVAPLADREAFMALLSASFQLHLDDAVRSKASFEQIGSLHASVPIRRLTYPRQFTRLPAVVDAVLADAGRPSVALLDAG